MARVLAIGAGAIIVVLISSAVAFFAIYNDQIKALPSQRYTVEEKNRVTNFFRLPVPRLRKPIEPKTTESNVTTRQPRQTPVSRPRINTNSKLTNPNNNTEPNNNNTEQPPQYNYDFTTTIRTLTDNFPRGHKADAMEIKFTFTTNAPNTQAKVTHLGFTCSINCGNVIKGAEIKDGSQVLASATPTADLRFLNLSIYIPPNQSRTLTLSLDIHRNAPFVQLNLQPNPDTTGAETARHP